MDRVTSEDSAARRGRWLAELAEALDSAGTLVKELGGSGAAVDAAELYARIEAVRAEVQLLRLNRAHGGGSDSDPEWGKQLPWRRSA